MVDEEDPDLSELLSRWRLRDEGMSCGRGREKFSGLGLRSLEVVEGAIVCKLSVSVSLTGLSRPKGILVVYTAYEVRDTSTGE